MSNADQLDNKRLSGAFDVLIKEIRTGERDLEQAISQCDAAEECLNQMYYLATGRSPEWSNKFGHSEALEDVGNTFVSLKSALQEAIDVFESMNDDEITEDLLPCLRECLKTNGKTTEIKRLNYFRAAVHGGKT